MQNIINDLNKLKKELELSKTEKTKLETSLKIYYDKLKNDFSLDSITSANDEINDLDEKISELQKQIEDEYKELKEKYDW